MPEEFERRPQAGHVKAMTGLGIDHEPDRNAAAARAGYSPVVAALHHVAAFLRRRPVVALADQDQGGDGHVALGSKAARIERDRRAKLVFRALLDRAMLDGSKRQPAALRKSEHRDATRIDEGF